MIEQYTRKEIESLIERGFDLDLISFELDIPIIELSELKRNLEEKKHEDKSQITKQTKVIRSSTNNIKNARNSRSGCPRMNQIRQRYNRLFLGENGEVKINQPKSLSAKDIELIESVISNIERKVQEMKKSSRQERRNSADEILAELKKIKDFSLTIEQSERLSFLLDSEELYRLSLYSKDKIDIKINTARRFYR